MCGIAGIYGFRDDKLIKKISSKLAHRGPDGEGYFINDKITLLNRRLAIIDVSGGDQPIYNENKSIVIVYNGEIYNYVELRKALKKNGHVFETKSDTEVIVHGYEQWGVSCFDRLNGMFAIALYDKKEDRIKCEGKWNRLTDKERETCIIKLPAYILSTPDKQYRKNPATYINNKSWENEIIKEGEKVKTVLMYDEILKLSEKDPGIWKKYKAVKRDGERKAVFEPINEI